jgi:hypothetical protein
MMVPESKSMAAKMVARENGVASHVRVAKAAHVAAKMPPTKATHVTAEMPSTKTAMAAVHGGRTQSRAGRDNRHGGQCYRYLPHHDVYSVSYDMHPSLYEG